MERPGSIIKILPSPVLGAVVMVVFECGCIIHTRKKYIHCGEVGHEQWLASKVGKPDWCELVEIWPAA